jgi:hypothetical protein
MVMTEQLIHLRCSSLPLAFRCPGSVRRGVVPINASNDAADVGTAGHEGNAALVRTGRVDWDGVPALAKKHDVDEKELRVLLALSSKLWEQVGPSFPNAEAEVALKHQIGSVVLTGHTDVMALSGTTLRVADWKMGRLDSNYREQLLGYCALGLFKTPEARDAEAGVLWVRDQEYEPYTMTRAGHYEWIARLEAEVVNWDGVYRPGSHCQYCPRSHECHAANAQARRDMAIIMDRDLPGHLEDAPTLQEMIRREPEKVVRLVELARTAEKQAKRALEAIKAEVLRSGDIVADGKRITIQTKEERELDVMKAFPVLQEELTDEEMAEVITLHVSKAEDIVAKKAGKGNGAAAKRTLVAKLNEAEAIKTSSSKALVVRREA